MLRFRELSLTSQLPFVAAICALLVALSLLWLAARSSAYLEEQRETLYGESLAVQIAANLGEPLQRGDLLSARASLQRFIDDTLAASVEIRDVEGVPMGAAGTPAGFANREYAAPIRIGPDTAGRVLVTLDAHQSNESRWRFLLSLLALAVALSLIVFMATRALSRRLAADLNQLAGALRINPTSETPVSANEITGLQHAVQQLPLDMLRAHAEVPKAATSFASGALMFVHMASLVRYVDKLGEDKLHRYSRRLQQVVQAAANCYGGEISVERPFGLLIRFRPHSADGAEALRAASCARLLALVANGLGSRTQLSFDMAMALGVYDEGLESAEDFYPQLHLQGAVDELQEACLAQSAFPKVLVTRSLREESPLKELGEYETARDELEDHDVDMLLQLPTENEALIEHQAALILDRIKPAR